MKKGWEYKTLGEISNFISDGDWIEKKDQSTSGIRLIQTGNIGIGYYKDKSNNAHYISEETFNRLKCTEIFENDILISRLPDPLGRSCIVPNTGKRMVTAVDCSIVRLKEEIIIAKWFIYFTMSNNYFLQIKNESSGTTRQRITRKKLEKFRIPIAEICTQRSIVSYLDTTFANIDNLKSNASKALSEAKALFQAALAEAMMPKEGWEEKTLKEVSNYSIGLTYKPIDVSEKGTIVLRSTNIQDDKLIFDDIVRVNKTIKESLFVKNGDILMCSRNGSPRLVGKVAKIEKVTEPMTFGTFMMIIRSKYNDFLYYFFKSDCFRNQIKHGEANMINQITRYMLDDVRLNLPPISEQHQIVRHLDTLSSKVRQMEENYRKTLAECDALKQAILRDVFE